MASYRICLSAAEVTPFAKTGGLGDVVAALARYLSDAGHEVRLFFPFYRSIDTSRLDLHAVDFIRHVGVRLGGRSFSFSLFTAALPGTALPVYLIHCPELYHRSGIYTSDPDEPLRFAMLCRATIESCQRMGWGPHVFHCHDWHTALLPVYLDTLYAWDGLFAGSRSVLTVHNVAYQGVTGAAALDGLDLAEHAARFDRADLEAGRINLLKTGLVQADRLTTVSPTHARELQTAELGMGLDGIFRMRSGDLAGILNGVDYEVWDPAVDPLIPFRYTPEDLSGKARNKRALLAALGLRAEPEPERTGPPRAPLLGIVSRLTAQKGIDLLGEVLPAALAGSDARLAVLGTGEAKYEGFFSNLERRFPGRVCFYRGFSEELAHRIEAGADIFLMPSRFEPCGLNQMYSLKYGTVPVVHATGGLADAVRNWDHRTGDGTGFVFEHFEPGGLAWALGSALETYRHLATWRRLMRNGMAQDFSWQKQIREYERVYAGLVGRG